MIDGCTRADLAGRVTGGVTGRVTGRGTPPVAAGPRRRVNGS
ncbi:hypothetical protein ACR3S4_23610 [Streptomyces sp. CH8.1]